MKLVPYSFVEDIVQCLVNREPGCTVAALILPFLALAYKLNLVEDKDDNVDE